MVGLVIASHGHLAEELVSTARQIIGDIQGIATCAVEPGVSAEELRGHLRKAVLSVEDGDGVIVFADLMGGSPCNQSLSLCRHAKLEVITGVNLPMLIKASSLRASTPKIPLPDLAHQLASYGQRNITCATDALRSRSPAA